MPGDYGPYIPPPEPPPGVGDMPPPYIPPAPASPPPPTQTGGSGGSGWFPVGYGGTGRGVGSTQTGGPLPPQFPWAGYQQAWQQSNNAAEQGLSALMGGMAVGSPYFNTLMQGFQNPYGLPPELMAQQRRMLAETEAGSRANALRRSEQSARAKGFGDSLGAVRAQDMIRTESAAKLNDAMNQLAIQDAMLAMQRQQGFGGLIGGAYGTDAGLRSAYANAQMGRQFPIMPQGMGGPYGGQPGWSQTGQYMPQGTGYDPFYQGGGPGTGQGTGYTPQNPYRPW